VAKRRERRRKSEPGATKTPEEEEGYDPER